MKPGFRQFNPPEEDSEYKSPLHINIWGRLERRREKEERRRGRGGQRRG
jgi:hypothetical protein